MGFQRVVLGLSIMVAVVGLATGDTKEECTNQLTGLSLCIGYVTGSEKAPTKDCCAGLNDVILKSSVCLCTFIKDIKSSDLGINATLAASLTTRCSVPPKYSLETCIEVLHLAPNSPEAAIFKSLSNSTKPARNSTTTAAAVAPAPATVSASGNSTNATSTATPKSGAQELGVGIKQIGIQMIVSVVVWALHS